MNPQTQAGKIESKVIMVAMCSIPELKEKEDEKDSKKLKELLSKRRTDEEG